MTEAPGLDPVTATEILRIGYSAGYADAMEDLRNAATGEPARDLGHEEGHIAQHFGRQT